MHTHNGMTIERKIVTTYCQEIKMGLEPKCSTTLLRHIEVYTKKEAMNKLDTSNPQTTFAKVRLETNLKV